MHIKCILVLTLTLSVVRAQVEEVKDVEFILPKGPGGDIIPLAAAVEEQTPNDNNKPESPNYGKISMKI